jgi:uncharacterized protein CbrC (UPF0167 family)
MLRTTAWIALTFSLVMGTEHIFPPPSFVVYAQEDWKAEFDDICAKTADSMSLSKAEIKDLIARCDKLKPRIEKLDESTAKVYLKRLQMCKDLYVFVLESGSK